MWLYLTFNVIALLESLNASGSIHHAALAGEEWMAVAAYFNLELFFSGTGGEFIAAGAYHYSIVIKFGMYFLFHIVQLL